MAQHRLNERQLTLLRRIGGSDAPVTSRDSALATTVYALRNRGLVTTPRQGAMWTAVITGAGRFYLEHGHHPKDVPASQPAKTSRINRPGKPRELNAAELVERLVQSGGTLTIANPDAATRAAWRRAIHAAKAAGLVPEGHYLEHSGRSRGDLVVRLLPGVHPAAKYQQRERIAVPEHLEDPHPVVASLRATSGRMRVCEQYVPRTLRIIQALIVAGEQRGYTAELPVSDRDATFVVVARGQPYEVTAGEEYDQTPQADQPRYQVQPARITYQTVPSGRLHLELPESWRHSGHRRRWADRQRWRLEDKLAEVLAEIERRAVIDEERQLAQERAEAERRRQWEAAMESARAKLIAEHRLAELRDQIAAWRLARRVRAYCDELARRLEAAHDPHAAASWEWIAWARAYADKIDPLRDRPPRLGNASAPCKVLLAESVIPEGLAYENNRSTRAKLILSLTIISEILAGVRLPMRQRSTMNRQRPNNPSSRDPIASTPGRSRERAPSAAPPSTAPARPTRGSRRSREIKLLPPQFVALEPAQEREAVLALARLLALMRESQAQESLGPDNPDHRGER